MGPGRFDIANYKPPGPVAAEFIMGTEWVPFIMGPVGSGKTNAAFFKLLRHLARMPPCKDGVKRAKYAVVRTDYRTLYKTTLSTWFRWFPRDFAGSNFQGGADRPATHDIEFTTVRGVRCQLRVEFQALGEHRIEDVMRGWEGSGAMMNEADLLEEDALDFLFQRTTRWPPKSDLVGEADLEPFVIGDLNPPGDPDHWIVPRFIAPRMAEDGSGLSVGAAKVKSAAPDLFARLMRDRPEWIHQHATPGHKLYQQPSGMSPQAENIKNLAAGYYENMIATQPDWKVHRFVHGKIGYDRSGMPVYPEFDERLHVAGQPLKPIPNVPIALGLDISGLHPAIVIVQRAANLQLRALRELYFGRMGPSRFGEHLAAVLESEFRDCPVDIGFYDPSNDYGADKEGGQQSAIDIIRQATRIRLLPAPSNEVPLRIEAVRNLLMMGIDSVTRGLISSPHNAMLNKGFASHYRFKLKRHRHHPPGEQPNGQVANADNPRPEKNDYANIHDALQYVALGLQGRAGAIASAAKGARPGTMQAARSNFVAPIRIAL